MIAAGMAKTTLCIPNRDCERPTGQSKLQATLPIRKGLCELVLTGVLG